MWSRARNRTLVGGGTGTAMAEPLQVPTDPEAEPLALPFRRPPSPPPPPPPPTCRLLPPVGPIPDRNQPLTQGLGSIGCRTAARDATSQGPALGAATGMPMVQGPGCSVSMGQYLWHKWAYQCSQHVFTYSRTVSTLS